MTPCMMYVTRLLTTASLPPLHSTSLHCSVTGAKLKSLDASTAVTRKFIRLGKFLGNAKELRVLLLANDALALTAGDTRRRDRGGVHGDSTAAAARLSRAVLLANRLGGAVQPLVESSRPMALKAPGFNPRT